MKPLILTKSEARELKKSGMTTVWRKCIASNVTVLGRPGRHYWNALFWDYDGTDPGYRVFADPTVLHKAKYEYLHVPAKLWTDNTKTDFEIVSYRVRPVLMPKSAFESRGESCVITSVLAEKRNGKWGWLYQIRQRTESGNGR